MALANDVPQTFDSASRQQGFKEISKQELDDFLKKLPPTIQQRRLIDCTQAENDRALCLQTACYKGQRALVYCSNGLCQKRVFIDCSE